MLPTNLELRKFNNMKRVRLFTTKQFSQNISKYERDISKSLSEVDMSGRVYFITASGEIQS